MYYKMMTPGPTQVNDEVMLARSKFFGNPDIDVDFVEEYKQLCLKISGLLNTQNETFILGGEGILGLEAACASLIQPGDKVLVIDNGIYGRGFADFVEMYGGEVTFFSSDYKSAVPLDELEAFLAKSNDFKLATVVHCDTPSGVLNNINEITKVLKKYNILTIVDAVSSMFGEPLSLENIDILCGGSQKVISAPPGLTYVVVSDTAKEAINNRNKPIASFYANLKVFFNYYDEKWFPYTMPASDIKGFAVAIDRIASDPEIYDRHNLIGKAARKAIEEAGLKLYLKNGYSNTVTVFEVPDAVTANDIISTMKNKYNILITGSFGHLAGKVIRIGHMGESANRKDMIETMAALDGTFEELGIKLKGSLESSFVNNL